MPLNPGHRFDCWAGHGIVSDYSRSMGQNGFIVVWPITDRETCGKIDGMPRPDQMLCWCPSTEKQLIVANMLEAGRKEIHTESDTK